MQQYNCTPREPSLWKTILCSLSICMTVADRKFCDTITSSTAVANMELRVGGSAIATFALLSYLLGKVVVNVNEF